MARVLPYMPDSRGGCELPLTFGTTFAGWELCQSKTGRSTEVERQRRFGTEVEAAPIAAAQIRTLIDSIGHYVQSLNYAIKTEEERTRCWDCRAPAYSVLAQNLTARRDNLAATITALQRRLVDAEALTYTPISSETKLLLPT
jgi:hypothetical protein